MRAANSLFYATFATSPEHTLGRSVSRICGGGFDTPSVQGLLKLAVSGDKSDGRATSAHAFPEIGAKDLVFSTRTFDGALGASRPILLTIEDDASRRDAAHEAALYRAWFEVTLRSIGDAVVATDPEARITFMNPTAERVTGWPEAEARGRPLADVFNIVNEETRQRVESPVSKAIRLGSIVGLANHTILISRDGAEHPIDDSAAPIRDAAGAIAGAVMVFHDITERREAERKIQTSEVRFRRLFESARDGILLMDPRSRRITDANPFMEELLEAKREDLIGKELWEIGLLRDRDDALKAFQQLVDTGYIRYEDLPLESASGVVRHVEFVSNVYLEGQSSIIQCNIRDITERKRLADERETLLESERLARHACEAANRAKDVFLATLSHELRTPLNAILGWSVILRTSGKCDSGDVAEGLAVIERNARVQGKLIEDVLDVARIASGKFSHDPRPCDVTALVFASVEALRPAASARNVSVEVRSEARPEDGRLWVRGDAARLQQVVWNLLTNAVKFTPKGGRVTVALGGGRDGVARVTVTDNGKGIPPQFLPYVFDRFKQADEGTTRVYGGLGLGLSIVRQIVEMHDGTVKAESDGEGLGASFTIELPRDAEPVADHAPAPVADRPTLEGLRVLVVDDERDARNLTAVALQSAGATITSVGLAAEGFALASDADTPFDVLVCDIGMPQEDGYSLMSRLRAAGHNARDLPAVALTAFAAPEDRRRALLAGFQVHLPKPVDPHDLIVVVASLTGRTGG